MSGLVVLSLVVLVALGLPGAAGPRDTRDAGKPVAASVQVAPPQDIPDRIKRGYADLAPFDLDMDGDGKPDRIVPRTFARPSGKPGIDDHLITFDLHLAGGPSFPAFFTFRYGDTRADYWVWALTPFVPARRGRTAMVFYAGDDTSDAQVTLVLRGGRFEVESWVDCEGDACTQRASDEFEGERPASRPGESEPAPKCGPDEAPWGGGCFHRYEWRTDKVACPEGVIQVPEGEERPRCTPCEEVQRQQPANYCAGLRAQKADAELKRAYKALLKDYPGHARDLRKAERAWIKERDAACERARKEYEGGSVAPATYAECLLDRTRRRLDEFERLRRQWSAAGGVGK